MFVESASNAGTEEETEEGLVFAAGIRCRKTARGGDSEQVDEIPPFCLCLRPPGRHRVPVSRRLVAGCSAGVSLHARLEIAAWWPGPDPWLSLSLSLLSGWAVNAQQHWLSAAPISLQASLSPTKETPHHTSPLPSAPCNTHRRAAPSHRPSSPVAFFCSFPHPLRVQCERARRVCRHEIWNLRLAE